MKIHLTLRILWGIFCLLLLLVNAVDYAQFTEQPELYPIGSEGLWWASVGLIASVCYRARYSGKILLIHFVLTLIMLFYSRIYMTV